MTDPAATLVRAGRVIVDPDRPALADAAILIAGSRFRAVGPRATVERLAPAGCRVFDASGLTALPGLIDMHFHPIDAHVSRLDEHVYAKAEANLAFVAGWGVTTARDSGCWNEVVLELRRRLETGAVAGPRLLAAGAPLTAPDGHCSFFGGAARGVDAVRDFVRGQARAGMTHLKIMGTGGGPATPQRNPLRPQFSAEELGVACREAAENGMRTMAHLTSVEGIALAVDAGIGALEHCLMQRCESGAWEYPDALVARMAAEGFWVDPTPSFQYRSLVAPEPGVGEDRLRALRATRVARARGYRTLLDAGHERWLVGSSSPDDPYPLACELMVGEWGMTPRQAVRAATTDAAAALGMSAEIGAIRPGMSADLVLVEGDPLRDIAALWRVKTVFARGRELAGHDRPNPYGPVEPLVSW